jgi:tetratricopeptide (TPR) repeat protein
MTSLEWCYKAESYFEKKEWSKAQDCYDKAIQIDSCNLYAHRGKSVMLTNQRKLVESRKSLKNCLKIKDDPESFLNVGIVLDELEFASYHFSTPISDYRFLGMDR